jgi:hypothetical protein
MADQEQESPTPALQEEDLAVLKLRTKNEAHLTSNLGYGNAKKRELEVFNTVVWPRLTEEGWCKVRRFNSFCCFGSRMPRLLHSRHIIYLEEPQ